MSLLPSSPDPPSEEGEPRVVGVDSEDADRLLAALSSETARNLLAGLHDEPATPSAIADRLDTSLQNAQYHIEKLEDAELVRVVDTIYSEKGREMNVYGPADRPLVMFAGRERKTAGLKAALSRLLGGVGVLALASLVIEQQLSRGGLFGFASTGSGGDSTSLSGGSESATTAEEEATGQAGVMGDEATGTPEPTGTEVAEDVASTTQSTGTEMTEEAVETTGNASTEFVTEAAQTTAEATTNVVQGGSDAAAAFSPGLLFFAGGMAVLLGVFTLWYLRSR